jgi:predicted lipoprotein with Yx(FWY)xxD motif
MRLSTRDKTSFADVNGSATPELFDALPTRGRPAAPNRPRRWVWLAPRLLGALAALATGAVHLYEFEHFYSQIPTIGTLFFLNFGATAIGLGLLAPIQRVAGRYGNPLLVLLAAAGIALAAVAFAFLLISEQTPLFGFKEPGYDPTGIAAARGAEIATLLFLGAYLVGRLRLKAPCGDGDPPKRRQRMKRLITLGIAIAAAVALAACGGGASDGTSASASGATGSGTGSSNTVSVRQLSGVGSVLVDHTGKALYSSDLEASGKIVCDDPACNAFWKPLTLTAEKPTASSGAGKLGMITRPDGSRQVTANGKPLYTFSEDSPGKATGDGFTDDFSGHHFTWNAVRASGTTASGAGSGSGGSTPRSTGGSRGNYGY